MKSQLFLRRARAVVLSACLCVAVWSPVVPAAAGQATDVKRETSTPYTGDLSHFDYPDRDKKLQVNRVMDLLGLKAGSSVADIGAGGGWFTMRAAHRVGPSGTAYAEDINPQAMDYIRNRAQQEHLGNVREVLGKPDNPELPVNSVDAVLLLKSYHEVAQPVILLRNLRAALRSDARVGIIDRNGNGADHGIDKDVVIKEAAEAGYKLIGSYDFVKADQVDYFLVFQPE